MSHALDASCLSRRQKVKRRVSNGSRPHKPRAQLQLDAARMHAAPTAINGDPIMDNVARLNRTGLNGLNQHGTDGLRTVSSCSPAFLACLPGFTKPSTRFQHESGSLKPVSCACRDHFKSQRSSPSITPSRRWMASLILPTR